MYVQRSRVHRSPRGGSQRAKICARRNSPPPPTKNNPGPTAHLPEAKAHALPAGRVLRTDAVAQDWHDAHEHALAHLAAQLADAARSHHAAVLRVARQAGDDLQRGWGVLSAGWWGV
eukprot:361054-Chlamydomonas_euryale.AAC.1